METPAGIGARDLLVEIGVEELPDGFLAAALASLPEVASSILGRERLAHGRVEVLGTPRRIAIVARDVATRQSDDVQDLTGPPERVAVDAAGGYTQAAIKFAARYGVGPEGLRLVDTPKGRVVAVTSRVAGRTSAEVVGRVLPEIFSEESIPYPHSMYWGARTGPFVRPVHWLVVLHGSEVIEAEMFGVRSGRATTGHRFHSSGPVVIPDAADYERVLEEHGVVVDQEKRRALLLGSLESIAGRMGARVVPDEDLVDEVVFLTERPCPIGGTFDPVFLALPESIVITAMAVHQRYFALRDAGTGALMSAFIAVSNTEPAEPAVVGRGYGRVLAARLEDARFCFEEDLRHGLSERVPGLSGIVYQKGLGTYLDKAERLANLAPAILGLVGADGASPDSLRTAAMLCKTDLLTKVVYEFPELQGLMGCEYARREGLAGGIPEAIRDHYKPVGHADDLPETRAGKVLAVADKIDVLTGFFAIGKKPKAGGDPFGLRRACLGAVRILLALGARVSFSALVDLAYPLLKGAELRVSLEETRADLLEFLEGRLRVLWSGDARTDLLDACLACGIDDVVAARSRLEALVGFQKTGEFEDLAVAFKRAFRIVRGETDFPLRPDPDLFEQPEEKDLHDAVSSVSGLVEDHVGRGNFSNAFEEFRKLRAPIDAFFERVFVSVEDDRIKKNRLALLSWIVRMIEPAARFDLVQFERTKLESS